MRIRRLTALGVVVALLWGVVSPWGLSAGYADTLRTLSFPQTAGVEELKRELQAGTEELPAERLDQVRDVFQGILGRDLLADIRWPAEMPTQERQELVEGAVKTMTAIAIQEKAPFQDPAAFQAYFLHRFGIRTMVMGAGRSRRFSSDPFESKVLSKPDGVNTVLKLALSASRINNREVQGKIQDVVVLSYNVMYHVLTNRMIAQAERQELIRIFRQNELQQIAEAAKIPAEVIPQVDQAVSEVLENNLRSTASGYRGDLRWTLQELERRLQKDLPALSDSARESILDDVGYFLTQKLLELPSAIDPAKQAEVVGDNVLLVLSTTSAGPGGSYYRGLEDLERRGLLGQTPFTLPVYGDQGPAILDQFASIYLIGYLTALNQLSWNYQGAPRFPAASLTSDKALGDFPVVVWSAKSPLDKVDGRGQAMMAQTAFGEIPESNREWKQLIVEKPDEARVRQELLEKSRRDKEQSRKTGEPYRPSHFVNGNVFIFSGTWALATFGEMVKNPGRFFHATPGSVRSEIWYTDLVEQGYEQTRARWGSDPRAIPGTKLVSLGENAPSGVGDQPSAQKFQRDYTAMLQALLERQGVTVDRGASVAISSPGGDLDLARDIPRIFQGKGIRISGKVRVDTGVVIGDGIHLKDVELRSGLEESSIGTAVESGAVIENSRISGSWISGTVRNSQLNGVVVAVGESVENETRMSRLTRFAQVVRDPQRFVPGAIRLGERPEGDQATTMEFIRSEVFQMFEERIPALSDRQKAKERFNRLLQHPVHSQMTNEELYQVAFNEIQHFNEGEDPFARDKREDSPERREVRRFAEGLIAKARAVNLNDAPAVETLLDELTLQATRANFLDQQSVTARQIFGQPGFFDDFEQNLAQVVTPEPGIDSRQEWKSLALDREVPGTFLYLVNNVEEAEVDAALWELLTRLGHRVVVGAKSGPVRGNATVADVRQIIRRHATLNRREEDGRLRLIGTGSKTYGTLLDRPSDELLETLTDPALRAVITKGEGNLYTTVTRNALKVPTVTLLLSKGMDVAAVTGVRDGQRFIPVMAVVPAGRHISEPDPSQPGGFRGTLKELVEEERVLNDFALESENYQALIRIFGDEAAAQREIRAWMRISRQTFRQAVLGQMHPEVLERFLEEDSEGFVRRQIELEQPDMVMFGGGASSMTNQQVIQKSPVLREFETVSVTSGSDNGGRTAQLYDLMSAAYGHTYAGGDITAAWKGMFPETVGNGILEADHKNIWSNDGFWASQGVQSTVSARLEFLLTQFARDEKLLRTAPNFVHLAVELMNLAAVADEAFIRGGVHDINLASIRHMVFNAMMVAVGAYQRHTADELRTRKDWINRDRFRVGLYLMQKIFDLPHRILTNSLDPQELYVEFAEAEGSVLANSLQRFETPTSPGNPKPVSVGERGQRWFSLAPDQLKPGGVARYPEGITFVDPFAAAQGRVVKVQPQTSEDVVQAVLQAKQGGMMVFGPSSFVVSLSPTILPDMVDAMTARPDLAKVMVLNLTRNSETLKWTVSDYIQYWQDVTGLPFEQTVNYLVVNTETPHEAALQEALQLAQKAGTAGRPDYPKVLAEFEEMPEVRAAIQRLKKDVPAIQDPRRELILALVLSDQGDSSQTYKDRGVVPPPEETTELIPLLDKGVTLVRGRFIVPEGERYIPGVGRARRKGAFHDQDLLAQAYEEIYGMHREWLSRSPDFQRRALVDIRPAERTGRLEKLITRLRDPLELKARQGPPARRVYSDLDKTAAATSDEPISEATGRRIRAYVEAGGEYHILTTRDNDSAERRLNLESTLAGLPADVRSKVKVHGRFGKSELAELIQARSQGNYLTMGHLEAALLAMAPTIPNYGEDPNGTFQGLAVGDSLVAETDSQKTDRNKDMTIMNRGDFGLYAMNALENDQVFAIITIYGARNRDPKAGVKATENDAFDPRPQMVAALRRVFPGANVTSTGFGSINVTWIDKSDLIEQVGMNEVPPAEIAFLDDEGSADGTGRKGLELVAARGGKAVLVGDLQEDLPRAVIQSERKGPEAHNRFLEIQTSLLLGKPISAVSNDEMRDILDLLVNNPRDPEAIEAVGLIRQDFPMDWASLQAAAEKRGVPLAHAGVEEIPVEQLAADWSTQSSVTLDVRVRRLDMADKEEYAARKNQVPHSYLIYDLVHPETGQVVTSMMVGFSPADVSPNDVILADVTMDQKLGDTALDFQFLRWIIRNTLDSSVIALRHRHWEDPEERDLGIRLSRLEQARQEFPTQGRFEKDFEDIPQYKIQIERVFSAAWKAGNLPDGEILFRGQSFPLPGVPRIDRAPAPATVSRVPVTATTVSSPVLTGMEETAGTRLESPVTSSSVEALGLTIASQLQLGRRENQEDALNGVPVLVAGVPVGQLFVVADGMGGTEAGEEASTAFITGIPALLTGESRLRVDGMDLADLLSQGTEPQLRSLVTEAFEGVATHIKEENQLRQSGTTGLMVLVSGGTAYAAWVGDTRLYLSRNQTLQLLTEDDAMGWEYLRAQAPDAGNLEIARQYHGLNLRGKNALSQDLGIRRVSNLNTHWLAVPLQPGDRLLLSTDGVHEAIKDEPAIGSALGTAASPEQAVERLMVLAQGGSDNRTAMVVDFSGPPATATSLTSLVTVSEPGAAQLPVWLLELEGRQLIVLAPAAAEKYTRLAGVVGQLRSVGNLSFVILPEDQAAIDRLVTELAVDPKPMTVREFGVEKDPWLDHFDKMARGALNILPRSPLEGADFRMLMRQMLANLAGVEVQFLSDQELDTVAAALGLGSQV
ncbi:MAG: protein phosphatase 2C domain-containing protein [Candidatus Omnitrophota bacterium]|nr:protein phosphatase 2C domain-containing protein [Candidatus Omnitrophota bacterium]